MNGLQQAHRRRGNASKHASQVGLRIDAVTLGAGDERGEDGGGLGGFVVAGEEPVLSADGDSFEGAFGGVVVDVEDALRGVDTQHVPLVEHVADEVHEGSVKDLVDNGGSSTTLHAILDHIIYDSFGNILRQTGPDYAIRMGYTGYQQDSETGLYYANARYYDPRQGRFISTDPKGFSAGDSNLYRYAVNQPTDVTDPSGMDAVRGLSQAPYTYSYSISNDNASLNSGVNATSPNNNYFSNTSGNLGISITSQTNYGNSPTPSILDSRNYFDSRDYFVPSQQSSDWYTGFSPNEMSTPTVNRNDSSSTPTPLYESLSNEGQGLFRPIASTAPVDELSMLNDSGIHDLSSQPSLVLSDKLLNYPKYRAAAINYLTSTIRNLDEVLNSPIGMDDEQWKAKDANRQIYKATLQALQQEDSLSISSPIVELGFNSRQVQAVNSILNSVASTTHTVPANEASSGAYMQTGLLLTGFAGLGIGTVGSNSAEQFIWRSAATGFIADNVNAEAREQSPFIYQGLDWATCHSGSADKLYLMAGLSFMFTSPRPVGYSPSFTWNPVDVNPSSSAIPSGIMGSSTVSSEPVFQPFAISSLSLDYPGASITFTRSPIGVRSAMPPALSAGQLAEGEQLGALGSTGKVPFTPTQAQIDSAAFKVIVGDAKYTPSGTPVGTVYDATVRTGLGEIKTGTSVLDSSYQLRLQTYGSLVNDTPFTIYTSRPVNPTFSDWLTRWGVTVKPLPKP